MKTVISLDEFRKNLSHIVGSVMYGNQTIRVQKHNKPGVVVISDSEYQSLKGVQKHLGSEENTFILLDKVRKKISAEDQKKLKKIIPQEIKAVRLQKKHEE